MRDERRRALDDLRRRVEGRRKLYELSGRARVADVDLAADADASADVTDWMWQFQLESLLAHDDT